MFTSLPVELVSIVQQWKTEISQTYQFEWESCKNEMKWSLFESNEPMERILFKNAGPILPEIRVLLNGLYRLNTPFGTEWWISFTTPKQEFESWSQMINLMMNQSMDWMPRLHIPIGTTKCDDMERLHKILQNPNMLPWQGKEWNIQSITMIEPNELEEFYHPIILSGPKENLVYETMNPVMRQFMYRYGIIPEKKYIRRSKFQSKYLPFQPNFQNFPLLPNSACIIPRRVDWKPNS